MQNQREKFERLLNIMDAAMNRMAAVHIHPHDFGTGVILHRAEIHTIQAIGDEQGINVTQLAQKMGVTKGAASQMVGKLVKKGMLKRIRSGDNAKEIHLELTSKGHVGHANHNLLHMAMYDLVKQYFGDLFEEKMDQFMEVMTDLEKIMRLVETQGTMEKAKHSGKS